MYDNFLFRKSWWDIIKHMPTEQRSDVIDYITQYMFEGIEPQFEEMTAVTMAVQFIIRDINADKERYDSITEKRREAGRKGAAVTNSAKVGKTANAEFADFAKSAENTKVGKNSKVGSIDIDYDKDKNNNTPPPSPTDARERLEQWISESNLTEWATQQFYRKGYKTEIDIGALLDDFYDNDFSVRERCEQNERMEVLKHFQNWLPKYINKRKNDNNNEQQHRNTRATADSTPADTTQRKPYSRISQLADTEFDIE